MTRILTFSGQHKDLSIKSTSPLYLKSLANDSDNSFESSPVFMIFLSFAVFISANTLFGGCPTGASHMTHIPIHVLVRPSDRISSLQKDKPQLNHAFHILINSYVEGPWKDNIISHPHLRDKGMEALQQMQLMCATLLLPSAIRCQSLPCQFHHIDNVTRRVSNTSSAPLQYFQETG
jgi:hypothetical protein